VVGARVYYTDVPDSVLSIHVDPEREIAEVVEPSIEQQKSAPCTVSNFAGCCYLKPSKLPIRAFVFDERGYGTANIFPGASDIAVNMRAWVSVRVHIGQIDISQPFLSIAQTVPINEHQEPVHLHQFVNADADGNVNVPMLCEGRAKLSYFMPYTFPSQGTPWALARWTDFIDVSAGQHLSVSLPTGSQVKGRLPPPLPKPTVVQLDTDVRHSGMERMSILQFNRHDLEHNRQYCVRPEHDGHFMFPAIAPGHYILSISRESSESQSVTEARHYAVEVGSGHDPVDLGILR
jgi:hypothetical protein